MWLFATRVSIAPGKGLSRKTLSPVLVTAKLLVVDIFKLYIASLIKYSLNIELNVALPSPALEKDVLPAPFN